MTTTFDEHARRYHEALPGFIRAALSDSGLSADVVDRRRIGWDGRHVTVPVQDRAGRTVFFERWDMAGAGAPVVLDADAVELYGWDVLLSPHPRVVFAEGAHEALVFESAGIAAVAATGSGRTFKDREWGPHLHDLPEVVLALLRGPRAGRRGRSLSRAEVAHQVLHSSPHARVVEWPPDVGRGGGASAFFKRLGRTASDFEAIL